MAIVMGEELSIREIIKNRKGEQYGFAETEETSIKWI